MDPSAEDGMRSIKLQVSGLDSRDSAGLDSGSAFKLSTETKKPDFVRLGKTK
jgi:hypothetical protein